MHIPLQVQPSQSTGFTLIEMSIVLVIIGLIVGGILTGRDLINTAGQRAQMSQIEKYNTAVRTFQGKYGYLPGDIPDPTASSFGFLARGTNPGEGDGNGLLQGNNNNSPINHDGNQQCDGELAIFWVDLTTANLLDANIVIGGVGYPSMTQCYYPSPVKNYLPPAKINSNNYVYVLSLYGTNYFAVSSVTNIDGSINSTSNPGLTVQQAYNIDSKMDDGLPQSGSVTACYINYNIVNWKTIWAAGGQVEGTSGGQDNGGTNNNGSNHCIATTTATATASTDCFGNNNTAGTMKYSVSTNANTQNCALSFKFQ